MGGIDTGIAVVVGAFVGSTGTRAEGTKTGDACTTTSRTGAVALGIPEVGDDEAVVGTVVVAGFTIAVPGGIGVIGVEGGTTTGTATVVSCVEGETVDSVAVVDGDESDCAETSVVDSVTVVGVGEVGVADSATIASSWKSVEGASVGRNWFCC